MVPNHYHTLGIVNVIGVLATQVAPFCVFGSRPQTDDPSGVELEVRLCDADLQVGSKVVAARQNERGFTSVSVSTFKTRNVLTEIPITQPIKPQFLPSRTFTRSPIAKSARTLSLGMSSTIF